MVITPYRKPLLVAGLFLIVLASIGSKDYAATYWLRQAMPGIPFQWAELNPISHKLYVYGLDYKNGGLRIQVPRLAVHADLASLAAGELNFPLLTLYKPFITVSLDKAWKSGEEIGLPPISHLRINDGTLAVLRASKPTGQQIKITADAMRMGRSDNNWQITAGLELAGGTAQLAGSVNAQAGRFHVKVSDVSMARLALHQRLAGLAIVQGTASGEFDVHAAFAAPAFSMDGHVLGKDVALTLPGQPHRQMAKTVRVDGHVDLLKNRWHLRSMTLNKPSLHINEIKMLAPMPASGGHRLSIDSFAMRGGAVTLLHPSPVGTASLRLSGLQLKAHGISERNFMPKALAVSGKLAGGSFSGQVQQGMIKGRLSGLDFRLLDRLALSMTGHRIYFGKVDAELTGSIRRQQLDAIVDFDIDDLVIGPRIPVRGADSSLPLQAAAASLTGTGGHTRFPIHLSGDITSPVASAIHATHQAAGNTVLNILGLPINLLLSAFSDNRHVVHKAIGFRNANARSSSDGRRTIKQLAHALSKNPETRLELRGCAYPVRDGVNKPGQTLQKLAASRARYVRRKLIQQNISPARIKIVYPMLWEPSPALSGLGPRVEASLLPS